MRVLAYLLTSSCILPQDERTTRILFGTWATNDDDEAQLQVFVRILSKLEKGKQPAILLSIAANLYPSIA